MDLAEQRLSLSLYIYIYMHHGDHEIGQVHQHLAAVLDRVQMVVDDIQLYNDRTDLVDPAIDTLNRQIHALTEEMNRVYALGKEQAQRMGSLERFNQMLNLSSMK